MEFVTLAERYAPLRGRHHLELSVLHTYSPPTDADADRWTASTVDYFYQVRERGGREVIAFHWHPGRRNQPSFPHLHVSSQAGSVHIAGKSHVPTGRVSLESVVRFLIEELGVAPVRADWEQVITQGQRAFDDRRSW